MAQTCANTLIEAQVHAERSLQRGNYSLLKYSRPTNYLMCNKNQNNVRLVFLFFKISKIQMLNRGCCLSS